MVSRWIFVRLTVAALVVLVFLALGTALASTIGSSTGKSASGSTRAANQRAASRDAEQLLGLLVLPLGARSSPHTPAGGGSTLARPSLSVATPDVVDRHAWWIVPGQPRALLGFLAAHPPAGSRNSASGSGGVRGVTTSWSVQFQWPPIAGVLQERFLVLTLVRLPGGSTGVRADAQDVWVIPRSASERIPGSARVLEVMVARSHKVPSLSVIVSDVTKVSEIAAMIDRLPIVQPGALSCPAFPVNGPFVNFTFRSTRHGPTLAQASEAAWASEPSSACEPMRLTIAGRPRTALLDGPSVVRKAQALLGVTLHRPL
ncbi:MAG TPA: hypothetical protein VIJ39_14220 [Solirubrobacteraceae bacterium]